MRAIIPFLISVLLQPIVLNVTAKYKNAAMVHIIIRDDHIEIMTV